MASEPATTRTRRGGFPASWPYQVGIMPRMDPSDDKQFYALPRFVTHIDERCIANLSAYYGSVLPPPSEKQRPRVLDIASSWISHLPPAWTPQSAHVVGVGMNEAELARNAALSAFHVVDLNEEPRGLSAALRGGAEEGFDAAVCSVSIDYLVRPREMLGDLHGLLKPGASVHLSFSNRCFPTKVVSRWLQVDEDERCDMVADYLHFAGTEEGKAKPGQLYTDIEIVTVLKRTRAGDPLYVVRGRAAPA